MSDCTGLVGARPGLRTRLAVERIDLLAPQDTGSLVRPSSPNTALAAPEGFQPPPDLVSPEYGIPAQELYAMLRRVGAAQPRTALDVAFDEALQAHYTVRSALFGFTDLVWVQALHAGPNQSQVFIWSRSVVGYYDFGVNRARLRTWLAAIDEAISPGRKGR